MSWAYKMAGPGFVKRIDEATEAEAQKTGALEPGQIRLKFLAGGICGSDMPLLKTLPVQSVSGMHDGAPIHEIVGEVIESKSDTLAVGMRVVGTGASRAGLSEFLIESDQTFIPIPDDMSNVEAVPIQSVATIIRAVHSLPVIEGRRIAIIGAGPIGLGFAHILKNRGAAHITMIDPVAREAEAKHYGADEFVQSASATWVKNMDKNNRPHIVIEAVGHNHATVRDALDAVATWGYVYAFGAPDDDEYALPMRQIYERGLTFASGRTLSGWVEVLHQGREYLAEHRADFADYVSHTIPVSDVQQAYTLYATPQASRIKVAIVAGS